MIYYIRNEVDDLIGFKYNNETYYYEKNVQGDIIAIRDSMNQLRARYTYDTWGNILSITDSYNNSITDTEHIGCINPYRYRSYYYDTETNLYYLNSRYYNPVWGRFINADGIVGANQDILSYNLYAYCSNNPVIRKDLNGDKNSLVEGIVDFVDTAKKIIKDEDIINMYAAVIYAEAAGQNSTTKRAVAHSMNNRVGNGIWRNRKTIEAVLTQPRQYDGYNAGNNRLYRSAIDYYEGRKNVEGGTKESLDDCKHIATSIYVGWDKDFTGNVVYFHSFDNAEDWRYHYDYELVDIPGTTSFWWYRDR